MWWFCSESRCVLLPVRDDYLRKLQLLAALRSIMSSAGPVVQPSCLLEDIRWSNVDPIFFFLSLFNTVPLQSLKDNSQRLNRRNRGLVLVIGWSKGLIVFKVCQKTRYGSHWMSFDAQWYDIFGYGHRKSVGFAIISVVHCWGLLFCARAHVRAACVYVYVYKACVYVVTRIYARVQMCTRGACV